MTTPVVWLGVDRRFDSLRSIDGSRVAEELNLDGFADRPASAEPASRHLNR